jgi:hypothetical protein
VRKVSTIIFMDAAKGWTYILDRWVTTMKKSEPPERVGFAPGATSAQRSGPLPSGPGVKQYVLAASAGQILEVRVTSPHVPVSFTIESLGGATWPAERFGSEVYVSRRR